MGGSGSNRWATTVTRVSTEGLLRLDIRMLAREGGLRPGTSSEVRWSDGSSITIEVDDPRALTLEYHTRTGNGEMVLVHEIIPLLGTPCTFGGTRMWCGCPGCGTRCAILYGFNGLFRCRSCHDLTYGSTRKMNRRR